MLTVHGIDELRRLAGTELEPSAWFDVTQERVDRFADATGDHQWIHVDVERAKTGPFGGTIAHGYLTLAMLIPMWSDVLRIEGVGVAVNYGLNKVRLPAPVPVGSSVRGGAELVAVDDVAGGIQTTMTVTVEVDGGSEPACVAQALSRYLF